MDPLNSLLPVLGLLGAGLVAGVFLAFSSFVMKALSQLPADQGIAAMQRINVTVINFTFLGTFIGTAVVSVTVLGLSVIGRTQAVTPFFALAAGVYLVGCFLVTVWFNIPLNNKLASLDPSDPEAATVWSDYLSRWTLWNTVRTFGSLAAAILFLVGMLQ